MAPPRRSNRGQTKNTKDSNTEPTTVNAKTSKPKSIKKNAKEVIANLRSTRASTKDKQSEKDETNDSGSDTPEPSNKRRVTLRSRESKGKESSTGRKSANKKASQNDHSENESEDEQDIQESAPAKKTKTSRTQSNERTAPVEENSNEGEGDLVKQETELAQDETLDAKEHDVKKTPEPELIKSDSDTQEIKNLDDSEPHNQNPYKPTNQTNELTLPAGRNQFNDSETDRNQYDINEIKNNENSSNDNNTPNENSNQNINQTEKDQETDTVGSKREARANLSATSRKRDTAKFHHHISNSSYYQKKHLAKNPNCLFSTIAKCVVSDQPDEIRFVPESNKVVNFELNSNDLKSRLEKFQQLKKRMHHSSQENHKEMILEHERKSINPKFEAKSQRKYDEAKKLLEKTEAEERGENYDRNQFWNYSVESVEKWDEKQAIKSERAQNGFTDYAQAAQKKYDRLTNSIKPNLTSYQQQKPNPSNVLPSSSSSVYPQNSNYEHQITSSHTHVNRPSNVIYGPHTFHPPTSDSIDRLAQFVSQDQATRSQSSKHRKVREDDEINYINDRNQKFNQKIARAYDQHTEDIRESFERGTAL